MARSGVGAALLLVCLLERTIQFCIFGGNNCTAGDPGCIPTILDINNATETAPVNWTFPEEFKDVCPDFDGKPNCCNYGTMANLKSNLFLVDLTFGNNQSGCSICAANIKRFWCMYNCAPYQSDFIIPGSSYAFNYTVDPTDPDTTRLVVTSNITLDIRTTCDIFESCKNVDFTKALGSMSTYQGLFNTFASQAVTQGNVLMNFTYITNSTAMVSAVNNCSMIFDGGYDQYGYTLFGNQGWCNCQHCASNCTAVIDYSQYIKQHGVLDGINTTAILKAGLLGGLLLVIGLVIRVFLGDYHTPSVQEGPLQSN